MADIGWHAKRDADGRIIPRCWETDSGFTVAECRLPETRYAVTRPGGRKPFAYVGTQEAVVEAIRGEQATAVARTE